MGLGKAEGRRNNSRCFNNMSSWAMDAPALRATAKTHKQSGEGGVPKSCSLEGAIKGLTTPLSEMLSDLIEPISRMDHDSNEAQSTEEVLRMIAEANQKLSVDNVRDVALGSMDVVALYPSLDQDEFAKIVADHIMESEVDFAGVDFDIAGVYLATVWSKERQKREGVYKLLPRKRSSRGR